MGDDARGRPGARPDLQVCDQRLSVEVDHIVPLSDGGAPWSLEGLQGICRPCHESKTGRETGGVKPSPGKGASPGVVRGLRIAEVARCEKNGSQRGADLKL